MSIKEEGFVVHMELPERDRLCRKRILVRRLEMCEHFYPLRLTTTLTDGKDVEPHGVPLIVKAVPLNMS